MDANEASQLLKSVCNGEEDAFHTFLEMGRELIPRLVDKYPSEADGEKRARIVEAIWQHRLTSTIPFLATALRDKHPEAWKQALDGLVAIGGQTAISALRDALLSCSRDDIRITWIEEALMQIAATANDLEDSTDD